VFDAGWLDQGQINWDGEETEQKNSAWSVLEKYFIDTPIKSDEIPEAVEVYVEADLAKHGLPMLIGVLDRRPASDCQCSVDQSPRWRLKQFRAFRGIQQCSRMSES
jgi:hypothetical protein